MFGVKNKYQSFSATWKLLDISQLLIDELENAINTSTFQSKSLILKYFLSRHQNQALTIDTFKPSNFQIFTHPEFASQV